VCGTMVLASPLPCFFGSLYLYGFLSPSTSYSVLSLLYSPVSLYSGRGGGEGAGREKR